jgi:polyribonucleotide nucleotidyltransferase
MKSLEELLFDVKNQGMATEALQSAIERAKAAGLPPAYEIYVAMSEAMPVEEAQKQRRREMVDQVNAIQRLEGYEPDEQLAQLQERFVAGELTTTEMIDILTDYAKSVQKGKDLYRNLTGKQRSLFDSIDEAVTDSSLSGVVIDPVKIGLWKKHVLAGMEFDELFQIIQGDKEKVIVVRPKPEYHDSPGMKHMGNGYFISGDDPKDPPVK